MFSLALIVVVSVIMSVVLAFIADSKGKSFYLWFILSLLLSPILAGFFLLIALMPGSKLKQNSNKKCNECAEMVNIDAAKCRFCGNVFDRNEEKKQRWTSMKKDALYIKALEYLGEKNYDDYMLTKMYIITTYPGSKEAKSIQEYPDK